MCYKPSLEASFLATSQHLLQMSLPAHTLLEPGCRPASAYPRGETGGGWDYTNKQEGGMGKHWDGLPIKCCLYSSEPAVNRHKVLLATTRMHIVYVNRQTHTRIQHGNGLGWCGGLCPLCCKDVRQMKPASQAGLLSLTQKKWNDASVPFWSV